MTSSISELDIRRLSKDRPDLEPELVEFFASAIESFVKTAQYPVLKNLRLAFFFDEEALDAAGFAESTFEELVQIGVFDVCSLQTVSLELIESFVRVLESLIEGSDEVANTFAQVMHRDPPELEPVQTRGFEDENYTPLSKHHASSSPGIELSQAGPVLSSVEAEQKLLAAFERVRRHSKLEEFGNQTLGSYWRKEWIRAPFVESLTFRQLTVMRLSNLLEKRTFSHHKVQAILQCVQSVCDRYEESDKEIVLPAIEQKSISAYPEFTKVELTKFEWRKIEKDKPLVVSAYSVLFERQAKMLPIDGALIDSIITSCSDFELGLLLLEAEFGAEYLADMLDDDEKSIIQKCELALRRVKKHLLSDCESIVQNLERLLQSPAVSVDILFGSDTSEFQEGGLTTLVASIILQSIGAEVPELEDISLDGCWTKKPETIEVIWNAIVAGSPKSKKAFKSLASSLLPYVSEVVLDTLWAESSIRPQAKSNRKAQ